MTAATHDPERILIVGCGYVGRRLAQRLRGHAAITAIVASEASARMAASLGISAAVLDLDRVRRGHPLIDHLSDVTVFYLAPPPRDGESDTRINRFLEMSSGRPAAFVYISTTGVYGDVAGEVVDERTPMNPMTDRARRRVSAEEITRVWCSEQQVRRVVLRVPGIYGPGRLPLERIRAGEPVIAEEDAGFTNHIHVEDLVEACLAAARNREARGAYNVSDGNPLKTAAYYRRVAAIAGLPEPPQISLDEAQLTFTPTRLSFLNESRRVSNERMLKDLGVKLRYADIDEGIRASLKADGGPGT